MHSQATILATRGVLQAVPLSPIQQAYLLWAAWSHVRLSLFRHELSHHTPFLSFSYGCLCY